MAEPAEVLNPEPIEPEPEQASTPVPQGQNEEPNIEVGTFLQFGRREFKNVTVAGIDPVSKRVLAFRRNGDAVERVLIPVDQYESALKDQKVYDKQRGIKQKKAMGRFVGGLLNRQVFHDGERAIVAGYDAKSNEALLMVDGKPKWVSTPALLQSQKNIGVVKTAEQTPAQEPKEFLEAAERFAAFLGESNGDKVGFERAFTDSGKKEYSTRLNDYKNALKSGNAIEVARSRMALERSIDAIKREITDRPFEGKMTDEQKKLTEEFTKGVGNSKNLLDLEKRIGRYVEEKRQLVAAAVPPTPQVLPVVLSPQEQSELDEEAAKVESETAVAEAEAEQAAVQVPAQGATAKKTNDRIRDLRQRIREKKALRRAAESSKLDWNALSNDQKQVYLKDSQRALLEERERLETYQIRIENKTEKTETDLRNLAEVREQIAENRTQYSLQQQASDKLGRGLEVSVSELPKNLSSVFTATVGVTAEVPAAVGGSQAAVIGQARAVLGVLSAQISARDEQSAQIRGQAAEISNLINALSQQAASLPSGSPERQQLEVRIQTASDERDGLQDQLTNFAVQNSDDRKNLESIKSLLGNVEQSPPEQAPPELVAQLQNRIPKNIPVPPAPLGREVAGKPAAIPPPRIPISQIPRSPLQNQAARVTSAPAPARPASRTPSAPAQPIKPPLSTIPSGSSEAQRAADLIGAQQTDRLAEQYPSTEGLSDSYEQAFAGEGGIGGDLSPLEQGVQQPMTETYVAGAPEEEEPEDVFMQREAESKRRMAERNKPQQVPVTQAAPGQAPPIQAAPTGQAPSASARPGAPAQPGQPVPAGGQRSVVQRLLSAQNQAYMQQQKLRAAQTAAAAAQTVDANLKAIQKLKRLYDVAKLGSAVTVWGIVLTVLTMNIQTLNKYTVKIRVIPAPTLIEDFAVFVVDAVLAVAIILFIGALLIIPAMIAAGIAGLVNLLHDPAGFWGWIRTTFNVVASS